MLPVKKVTASAIRSCRVDSASSRARRRFRDEMLRSSTKPFAGATMDDIHYEDAMIHLKNKNVSLSFADALKQLEKHAENNEIKS